MHAALIVKQNPRLDRSKHRTLLARKYRPKCRSLRSALHRQLRPRLNPALNLNLDLNLHPSLHAAMLAKLLGEMHQKEVAAFFGSVLNSMLRSLQA